MAFDWPLVFGRVAPRVIDVGCGGGRFVIESAAARPDRDFLGIDPVAPVIERASREAIRRGLPNARFIVADAAEWLATQLAPGSIDELHVYHPQPYYDPGQTPVELLSPAFFASAWTALRPEGTLFLQTDNRRYGKHLLEAVAKHFEAEVLNGAWPDAPEGRTEREVVARGKGLPILRVVARRRGQPLAIEPPPPYFDPGRPGLRTRRSKRKKGAPAE
jgi:tRNA (guanine-N7-)-methyltransferase